MPRVNFKRLARFSIATLLFAMLCVAGYFGGYRSGFDSGKADRQAGAFVVRSYPIADLITLDDDKDPATTKTKGMDQVIDLIIATVSHDSWMENGTGEGEIQPFPTNASLVISQTQRVHMQVAALLDQLRKLKTKVEVEQTIPLFQSLAASQREDAVAIREATFGTRGAEAIDLLFDSAVDNIADRWGRPDFSGAATERGFPDWSVAQRLATWPRAMTASRPGYSSGRRGSPGLARRRGPRRSTC